MSSHINYIFGDVSEHDMDMLFMEEFSCSERFLSLFTDAIGISNATLLSIELSKTEISLGESDITVILQSEGIRIGLLIEDKIDAIAMPEQSARYSLRGQKGIERGDYNRFFVFIIAPDKYLKHNKEAQKYPNKITYEIILDYFKSLDDIRSEFKIMQITQAIDKQKRGYQVVVDTAVTSFWKQYWDLQREQYPDLFFLYKGEYKGSNATWPRFNTVIEGLFIYHKTEFGVVDLTFEGCSNSLTAIERILSETINDYLQIGYTINPTGKSAAVRLSVPKLDMHESFNKQKFDVNTCLACVKKMSEMVKKLDIDNIRALLSKQ